MPLGPWRHYRRTRDRLDAYLRDIIVVVLGSGAETVAYSSAWAAETILAHRDVTERIRCELQRVAGGAPLSVEQLPRLRYLEAAVVEAMRLRPINPIVPRRVLEPGFSVAAFALPAGTYIAANGFGAQHRAESYPDPARFRPERWLDSRPGHCAWQARQPHAAGWPATGPSRRGGRS